MSSTSRSPGEKKPVEGDEPPSKGPGAPSPGRYSLSTEGSTEMAAVRIDSTRMAAVRPESIPAAQDGAPPAPPALPPLPPPPSSQAGPPRRGTLPRGMEAVPAPVPPPLPRTTRKLVSDAPKASIPAALDSGCDATSRRGASAVAASVVARAALEGNRRRRARERASALFTAAEHASREQDAAAFVEGELATAASAAEARHQPPPRRLHVSRLRRRLDRVRVRRAHVRRHGGPHGHRAGRPRAGARALCRARGESHASRARLHDRREVGRGAARVDRDSVFPR